MRLSWDTVLPVWWSFAWRAVLYGFLAGAVAGFSAGMVAGGLGEAARAAAWGQGAGLIAGWIASIPALKHALEKHTGKFGVSDAARAA